MRVMIIVCALSLMAVAQAPGNTTNGAKRAQMMQRFDTNHDGVLSDQEKAAAKAAGGGSKGNRVRFDTNGDGQIDAQEQAAGFAALQAKNPKRFAKYDTNGDGKLDATEQAVAMAAIKAKMAQRAQGK